ncbi:sigma-70 family RNA polymerase sigma factor [uncultured Sanguibacteroides sp.]|uniref:RNA polymerase sigma factor n=1 Tax=uncultured Sanguibacteroides sp. TaxID=1635151 RepID=UPI0025DEE1C6|nr:sigma-70 family RNA polymerase sigma factor [uncultured Sanguibacteroides sp.]
MGVLKIQERIEMRQLYHDYYEPLVLWADTIVKDMNLAEDVVQEFFIRLWEKKLYEHLKQKHLKSYLYTSVRNLALRKLQTKNKIENLPDISLVEKVWEDADHTHDELIKHIMDEIQKLPPRSRKILECVHLKNMKYAEVAEEMGVSVSTVKTLLVRCVKSLRQSMEGSILLFYIYTVKAVKFISIPRNNIV